MAGQSLQRKCIRLEMTDLLPDRELRMAVRDLRMPRCLRLAPNIPRDSAYLAAHHLTSTRCSSVYTPTLSLPRCELVSHGQLTAQAYVFERPLRTKSNCIARVILVMCVSHEENGSIGARQLSAQ